MSVTDGSGEIVNFDIHLKRDRVCHPREVTTTHCRLISALGKLGVCKDEFLRIFDLWTILIDVSAVVVVTREGQVNCEK